MFFGGYECRRIESSTFNVDSLISLLIDGLYIRVAGKWGREYFGARPGWDKKWVYCNTLAQGCAPGTDLAVLFKGLLVQ